MDFCVLQADSILYRILKFGELSFPAIYPIYFFILCSRFKHVMYIVHYIQCCNEVFWMYVVYQEASFSFSILMWQIVLSNVELNLIGKNSWRSLMFFEHHYDFCCFLEVLSFHKKIKKKIWILTDLSICNSINSKHVLLECGMCLNIR